MRRAGAGEHVDRECPGGELAGVQPVEVRPGEDLGGVLEAHLVGDGTRGRGVVAGDHLDSDAGLAALRHGSDRLLARRIDQAQEPEQLEATLDVGEGQRALARVDRPHRDRQHALTLRGEFVHPAVPKCRVERRRVARRLLPVAHREQSLRRTLHVKEAAALMVVVQRGHEAVQRVERNDVGARAALGLEPLVVAGLYCGDDQRAFHRIALDDPTLAGPAQVRVVAQERRTQEFLEDGFSVRGDVGTLGAERAAGLIADPGYLVVTVGRGDRAHGHLVPGERAGLVGADDRDRAQRLDRRQAAHDGVAPRHPLHADSERDGKDRRQAFGDRRHRQADHGHEHVGWVEAAHQHAEEEGRGGDGQNHERQLA